MKKYGVELPDLLREGETVESWQERRKELRKLVEECFYGAMPEGKGEVTADGFEEDAHAFADKAVLTKLTLHCTAGKLKFSFPVVTGFPKDREKVPVFVLLNFRRDIPDIYFPAEEILDNGFGFLRICYTDVLNDNHFGDFSDGLAEAYYHGRERGDTEWGKIGMWAYAAQRSVDYLETLPQADKEHIMVIGHSRLGKTALWTAATDERFYAAFVNDSGAGGSAILRCKEGERVIDFIRAGSWDWYTQRFQTYVYRENEMPCDAHYTLALIAPRLVCIGTAEQDWPADPKAECLNCRVASEVWELYGKKGLVMPERDALPDEAFQEGCIGYHMRSGSHYLSRTDWLYYMAFAKKHMEEEKGR